MQTFSISPREMISSFMRNRALIFALTQREVVGRYRGSAIGVLWSFLNPVLMLLVYTFVFSVVFKARWNSGSDSKSEFALALFAGLLIFNLFAECVNRAPSLILGNANYVKKVVFPLEILPWVALSAAAFHALISLFAWLVAFTILVGIPHASVLLLPLVVLPLFLFVLGVSWYLASMGVFLRDISQFIGIVTTVLMFLSPLFYPATALPEEYRSYLLLNPLSYVIERTRDILLWGKLPDFLTLMSYILGASLVAWSGFAWFQKTRKGFADVI